MFGILNDLTARRAALAEGGGDGVPVPDKVIFVFSAAQKNELALLQRPLVADAMCALLLLLLGLRNCWFWKRCNRAGKIQMQDMLQSMGLPV